MPFRQLARDHALTEIYSYIVEAISREPGWHARYFGLSDAQAEENAEATVFLEALLFRRYEAKLRYELELLVALRRGRRHRAGLRGVPHRGDGHPLRAARATSRDMDGGFYSADYLRAWIRSAQLRGHLIETVGEDWWQQRRDGRAAARALPRRHEAFERGDRRAHRLRPARHRAAPARARRLSAVNSARSARPIRLVA